MTERVRHDANTVRQDAETQQDAEAFSPAAEMVGRIGAITLGGTDHAWEDSATRLRAPNPLPSPPFVLPRLDIDPQTL